MAIRRRSSAAPDPTAGVDPVAIPDPAATSGTKKTFKERIKGFFSAIKKPFVAIRDAYRSKPRYRKARAITFGILAAASAGLGIAGLLLSNLMVGVGLVVSVLTLATSALHITMCGFAIKRSIKDGPIDLSYRPISLDPHLEKQLRKTNLKSAKHDLKRGSATRATRLTALESDIAAQKTAIKAGVDADGLPIDVRTTKTERYANVDMKAAIKRGTVGFRIATGFAIANTALSVLIAGLTGFSPVTDSVLRAYSLGDALANESGTTAEYDPTQLKCAYVALGSGTTALVGAGLTIYVAAKGIKKRHDDLIAADADVSVASGSSGGGVPPVIPPVASPVVPPVVPPAASPVVPPAASAVVPPVAPAVPPVAPVPPAGASYTPPPRYPSGDADLFDDDGDLDRVGLSGDAARGSPEAGDTH